MLKYVLRKLVALIPKLLAISLILFVMMDLLPGDPLTRAMNPDTYGQLTEELKEHYREAMGLNKPLPVRYLNWLGNILKGDFGWSTSTKQNIGNMLAGRFPYTVELSLMSVVIGSFLGILFGYIASIFKNTIIDYGLTLCSVIGVSVPNFFFGIVFLLAFAVKLKWLPTGGRMEVGGATDFFHRFKFMILPIMTQSIGLIAALMRYTRSTMLDVLNRDYIKTARSKGLREATVNFKHGFRNAMIPVMTIVCMRIPMIVGGSVVVESVFNYPGTGQMSLTALTAGDIPVVMVTTMVSAAFTLAASTIVDIVTAMLDPRIRME